MCPTPSYSYVMEADTVTETVMCPTLPRYSYVMEADTVTRESNGSKFMSR